MASWLTMVLFTYRINAVNILKPVRFQQHSNCNNVANIIFCFILRLMQKDKNSFAYEVAIVGGSNGGLAAALTLGRSNRKIIVFDTGEPGNNSASQAHNLLTRDGEPPEMLLSIGREQLKEYPSIVNSKGRIIAAKAKEGYFELTTETLSTIRVRKLILATGVQYILMDIKGLRKLWGKTIVHCPYCHGWEIRDRPIAIIAHGDIAYIIAITVSNLNKDIVILLNGTSIADAEKRNKLIGKGWEIIATPIAEILEHEQGIRIIFTDGTEIIRAAAYAKPKELRFNNQLAVQLGCELHETGSVATDDIFQTTVPGVFAVGDLSHPGFHQISAAIAGGHKAGAFCNVQLCREDF
jgi:thioredoxin reductase